MDTIRKLLRPSSGSTSLPRSKALGAEVLVAPERPKVDVVFVHGLTGHREATWTAQGEAEPWPRSLLAKDLPTARIIVYGYDADVLHLTRVAGQNTVRDCAKTLINDLAGIRMDEVGRPIIFVVHSLGGLVVQDALLISNNPNDNAQRDILVSTRGVAFLGTPHAGADLEKFASAVANVVSIVKRPNKRLLKVLNKNSETLANIKDGFHTMVMGRLKAQSGLAPIELHAFIEEQPLALLERRVVEPDSAKIPGYNYDTIPANHMEMTKFHLASDPGYRRVLHRLKRWVGDDQDDEDGSQYTKTLCRALGVKCADSEPSDSVKLLWESLDQDQSIDWFTESSEYQFWKTSKSANLWIQGAPREGKTVVMSYVLRSLRQSSQSRQRQDIISIFCSCEDSEEGLLASMIAQFLQENQERVRVARTKFPVAKFQQPGRSQDPTSILWEMLEASIEAGFANKVFLLDGIDALAASFRYSFLDRFNTLAESHTVRVILSSNTDDNLKRVLAHYSTADREKERRECLKTLFFQEWNARESRVDNVTEGGGWLSSHPAYNQWRQSSTSSFLWLEGKPGSGKSTLAKLIVRKLEQEQGRPTPRPTSVPISSLERDERPWTITPKDTKTIIARFYYSFRGGSSETSHALMLRSIVYQIWDNYSRLFPLLRGRYRELRERTAIARDKRELWSYEDLKSILDSLHQVEFGLKIMIVVDGLDESDNDRRADVLNFLPRLATQSSKCIIKLLIASRPESDINSRLLHVCSHHVKLQQVNEGDIRSVLDRWFKRMESEYRCAKETFQTIKAYIMEHSLGVFLWVILVLRDLEQCVVRGGYSKADLDRRVFGLPKELGGEDGFYRAMVLALMKSCEGDREREERGRRILAWISFPVRPLFVEELQDVLASPRLSETVTLSNYDLAYHRPIELDQGILSTCGGLAEVRESKSDPIVQLIHQTAREFLLDKTQIAKPYHLDEVLGDIEIATTCSRYIQIIFTNAVPQLEADAEFSHARQLSKHLSGHLLLLYALANFTRHLDHLQRSGEGIRLEFEDFIVHLSSRRNSYPCLLLQQWIGTLDWPTKLQLDVDETSARSCVRAVLSSAIDAGQGDVAKVLLALRKDLLHLESQDGNERSVEALLEAGADVNAQDAGGQTPLHLAGQYGHRDLIRILIKRGADLNAQDAGGRTPLHPARNGHHDLISILIENGGDETGIDLTGQSPRQLAV